MSHPPPVTPCQSAALSKLLPNELVHRMQCMCRCPSRQALKSKNPPNPACRPPRRIERIFEMPGILLFHKCKASTLVLSSRIDPGVYMCNECFKCVVKIEMPTCCSPCACRSVVVPIQGRSRPIALCTTGHREAPLPLERCTAPEIAPKSMPVAVVKAVLLAGPESFSQRRTCVECLRKVVRWCDRGAHLWY